MEVRSGRELKRMRIRNGKDCRVESGESGASKTRGYDGMGRAGDVDGGGDVMVMMFYQGRAGGCAMVLGASRGPRRSRGHVMLSFSLWSGRGNMPRKALAE